MSLRVEDQASRQLKAPVASASSDDKDDLSAKLTSRERWNILLLVLAFSCVVASLTMIVGAGNLVILSIGGSESVAPFALACFFLGMSFGGLVVYKLNRYGRKVGLWFGAIMGCCGAGVACLGLHLESEILVLVSKVILGLGTGIGMGLRFAAAEAVSSPFASRAITLTLCGGCLAAFVGPEIAAVTRLGQGKWIYVGLYVVSFCFNVVEAVLVSFVRFNSPPPATIDERRDSEHELEMQASTLTKDSSTNFGGNAKKESKADPSSSTQLLSLLLQPEFLYPLFISILCWAVMAMPMSIFRVVMHSFGFTTRQSLTVIEVHFLSMYAPGFVTGTYIKKYGSIRAWQVAICCLLVGTIINLVTQENTNTSATWLLGFIFLGIGWNFAFSGATVAVTKVYEDRNHFKSQIQAANEFGTFFLSGALIFSAGYLYTHAGGGGLNGWRILNFSILGLNVVFIVVLFLAMKKDRQQKAEIETDVPTNGDNVGICETI